MRSRIGRWSLWVLVAAFVAAAPMDTFAQRRSSGGSRRSTPRRTTPKRTTPKPKPAKRTTPKASKPKASKKKQQKANTSRGSNTGSASKPKGQFGNSQKKAGKSKKATKADQDLYKRAKQNGTAFKDRKSAMNNFRQKNASKYTSNYKTQPTSRPSHIPQSTMVGGTQTTIVYNQQYGGYGYMSGGRWMMYDAMADAAMAGYFAGQMRSAGYHYGPAPVVASTGFGFMSFLYLLIALLVVFALLKVIMGGGGGRSSYASSSDDDEW